MFCKDCGTKLDDVSGKCPRCGKPAARTGGNSFWDMANSPETRQESVETVVKETVIHTYKKAPVILCAALSVLCLLMLLIHLLITDKALDNLRSSNARLTNAQLAYEEEIGKLDEQLQQLTADNTALGEKLDALSTETEEQKKAISAMEESLDEDAPLLITHQPTDESRVEGTEGICLFACEASGEGLSFHWKKKSSQSDQLWAEITFSSGPNAVMYCREYGLSLEEDAEAGYSRLMAFGLTEAAAGDYRCVVTDEAGRIVQSNMATLTVLPRSAHGSSGLPGVKGEFKHG